MIVFLGLGTRSSIAQDRPASSDASAEAEALFRDGRALEAKGDYGQACPKLARSYDLDPAIGTLFYYAECLEHVGKLASALRHYQRVARLAQEAGEKDRAAYAEARIEAVRPHVPKLELRSATQASVLTVTVDGVPAPNAVGHPLEVDAGEHVVVVAANGKSPWTKTVNLSQEGATVTVDVPELASIKTSPSVPAPVAAAKSPPRPMRTAGLALGGVGLVGLGVGAVAGGIAIAKGNASKDPARCDANDFCDSEGADLRRAAISAARVSTVAFIAGGCLVAGGVALILLSPSKQRASRSATIALSPSGLHMVTAW